MSGVLQRAPYPPPLPSSFHRPLTTCTWCTGTGQAAGREAWRTSEIEPWAWTVGWWWLEFLPDLLTDGHGTYLHR